MANSPFSQTVRTIELPLHQIVSRKMIAREVLGGANWELKTHLDYISDSIVVDLIGYFASQPLIDTIDVKYPKDWLEALKERFAPSWLLKKYPVRYVHHYADVRNIFPDFVVPKNMGRSVKVAEHRSWESLGSVYDSD
jgi:hypothetical protein